jgi:hypothetical protein
MEFKYKEEAYIAWVWNDLYKIEATVHGKDNSMILGSLISVETALKNAGDYQAALHTMTFEYLQWRLNTDTTKCFLKLKKR